MISSRIIILTVLIVPSLGLISCKEDVTDPLSTRAKDINQLLRSIPIDESLINPPSIDESTKVDSAVIVRTREGVPEIWICRQFERSAHQAYDQYALLRPNSDVIWPGAALQGGSIRRSTPDPITARRGSGKVVITNITGTSRSSIAVPEMTISNVIGAANEIISVQSNEFPASLSISFQRVRTREELQFALNASAEFLVFSGAASLDFTQSDTVARFLVSLTQSYYTLVYERPSDPSDFFHDEVTADQLQTSVGIGNPPVYISQVNYGRVFHLLIEADASYSELSSAISTDFIFGGGDIDGRHLSSFNNLRVQCFAIGGDQEDAISAVQGGLTSIDSFLTTLKHGSEIGEAVPLAYSVRSVYNDRLVKNAFTTRYTFNECFPSGVGPCIPSPLSPVANQKLPNGCEVTPHSYAWKFEWTPCPEATEYELVIAHAELNPYRKVTVSDRNSYTFTPSTPFSSSTFYSNWYWMVRAKVSGGWGEYSPVATFRVEPINTACPTGIKLYEHPNYQGDSRWITEDVQSLDLGTINFADVASSLRIYNLREVRCYDFENYGGSILKVTNNVPDLRTLNFNDRIGSVDIPPLRR